MVLIGDEDQVDARFGLFGDCANLDARYVHGFRVTWLKWMLVSVCLEIVLILTQDRCLVCVNVPQARK
jgi:hypothetical protein